MPSRAKYLTDFDVAMIIKLRGKEKPINIAKKYQIGLTRLYKIWTDASQNKKFPGGFAGTQAGKNLTETVKKLNEDVKTQREFISKTRTEHIENIKKSEKLVELITASQQRLDITTNKYKTVKQRQQQLDNLLKTTPDNQQQIKTLTEQHQEQLTTINKLKEDIENNKKVISEYEDICARQQEIIRPSTLAFPEIADDVNIGNVNIGSACTSDASTSSDSIFMWSNYS